MTKDVLLLLCTSLLGKRIALIAGKTTWEISPVVRITRAFHPDFISVVHLRCASNCEENREGELQLACVSLRFGHESGNIVIAFEGYESLRMRIQPIEAKRIRESQHRSIPNHGS